MHFFGQYCSSPGKRSNVNGGIYHNAGRTTESCVVFTSHQSVDINAPSNFGNWGPTAAKSWQGIYTHISEIVSAIL